MATWQQLIPGAGFVHETDTAQQLAPGSGFVNTTATSSNTITLDSGSYTLTGGSLGLSISKTLSLGSGSYTITGQSVGLTINRVLTLGSGSYSLTGGDVGLSAGKPPLVLDSGSYTLTGGDVGLYITRVLTLDAGGYFLDGQPLQLAKTGGAGDVAWPMSRGWSRYRFGGYLVFGGDDLPPINPPNPVAAVPLSSYPVGRRGVGSHFVFFTADTPPPNPDSTGQMRANAGGGMSVTATSQRSGSGVIALEAMMDTVPTPTDRSTTVSANGGARASIIMQKAMSAAVNANGGAMLYSIQSTSTQGGQTTSASAAVVMNVGGAASVEVLPEKSGYVYADVGGGATISGVASQFISSGLTPADLDAIAAKIMSTEIESGLSFQRFSQAVFAATAGTEFQDSGEFGYKSYDGSKKRIRSVVQDGKRVIVTYEFD